MVQANRDTRNHAINIRASQRQRDLIDRAARILGKTRSDFMIETVSREAETVLLDQALFQLDDAAYDQFMALLDDPPPPSPELRKLLAHKAPWE